jgi:hypothetical protein
LESRWEMPKYPGQLVGEEVELPKGYRQKRSKFLSLFSEVLRFCSYLLKIEEAVEIFALSNQTTFSQTKTGVTVP